MDRLINFLLRMALRLFVVLLVTLWGVSRVSTLGFERMSGFNAQVLNTYREGIMFHQISGELVTNGGYWIGDTRSWDRNHPQLPPVTQFLGVRYAKSQGYFEFGVSYLTMIVPLVVVYAILSRTRRKRVKEGLRQRLKRAAEEEA